MPLYDGHSRGKDEPGSRAQAICYQCHAPRIPDTGTVAAAHHWGPQVGSGNDRTPMGVHEGLSCLSCHIGHDENATASCKTCHPQMSHCGIDVEKMDTTYFNAASVAQYPLGQVHGLPSARHTKDQDARAGQSAVAGCSRQEWMTAGFF